MPAVRVRAAGRWIGRPRSSAAIRRCSGLRRVPWRRLSRATTAGWIRRQFTKRGSAPTRPRSRPCRATRTWWFQRPSPGHGAPCTGSGQRGANLCRRRHSMPADGVTSPPMRGQSSLCHFRQLPKPIAGTRRGRSQWPPPAPVATAVRPWMRSQPVWSIVAGVGRCPPRTPSATRCRRSSPSDEIARRPASRAFTAICRA